MIWVPEERLYVRIEDVVVITADGMENFTEFIPVDPQEIERIMQEPGILQFRPSVADPTRQGHPGADQTGQTRPR